MSEGLIQPALLLSKVWVGYRSKKIHSHTYYICIYIQNTAPDCPTATAVQGRSILWALLPGQPDTAAAFLPEAARSRRRPLFRQCPPARQLLPVFCKAKLTRAETWFYSNWSTFQTLRLPLKMARDSFHVTEFSGILCECTCTRARASSGLCPQRPPQESHSIR